MKTKLALTVLAATILRLLNAQTILPVTTSELCPATLYTFTVTLDGNQMPIAGSIKVEGSAAGQIVPAIPVTGTYNFTYTSATNKTSFAFQGRFQDLNKTQRFRIYKDGTSTTTIATFDYNRIRALDIADLQTVPATAISSPVVVGPCQVQTFSISFPQVSYLNTSTSPAAVFGSVSNYEYLIPSGWKVNTTTSDGVSWIRANNSVTITSDLTTGNGGEIRIRAVNACATPALILKTGAPRILTISRPRPQLTFSGATPLCSTATYTASNIPAAFPNYLWSVSSTQIGTIVSPNSASTQIIAGSGGVGNLTFTINGGATCPLSYVYNTADILGQPQFESGTPQATWPEPVIAVPGSNCIPMGYNVTYQSNTLYSYTYYRWGYYEGPLSQGGPFTEVNPGGGPSQAIRITNTETINSIYVAVANQCGLGIPYIKEIEFDQNCNWGGDVEYRMAGPQASGADVTLLNNPVKETLTMNIAEGADSEVKITITSIGGQLVKEIQGYGSTQYVDVSGLPEGVYIATYTCRGLAGHVRFVKM